MAITLAYLALDRFRYRKEVESVASELHKKYENNAQLGNDTKMEWLQELKWLCRKECNGHSPNSTMGWVYGTFFRRQGDLWLVSLLAVLSAAVMIQGVAGQADIWPKSSIPWVNTFAFAACSAAMSVPAGAILLGRRCRNWAKLRAEKCDDQIAHALTLSAQEAKSPVTSNYDDLDDDNPF